MGDEEVGIWDGWLFEAAVSLFPHAARAINAMPPMTTDALRGKRMAVISLGVPVPDVSDSRQVTEWIGPDPERFVRCGSTGR
jgi:hypothetical protein